MAVDVRVVFMDGDVWEKKGAIRVVHEMGTVGVQTRRKSNTAGPAWTEFSLHNVRQVEVDQKKPSTWKSR